MSNYDFNPGQTGNSPQKQAEVGELGIPRPTARRGAWYHAPLLAPPRHLAQDV